MSGMYCLLYIFLQRLLFWKNYYSMVSFFNPEDNSSIYCLQPKKTRKYRCLNNEYDWRITQSSVKEVLTNFLIAKAIFTSENSCELCTCIAKKYCLQQQKILRKTNRIGQSPGKLQDIKCIWYFLTNHFQFHTQPIRFVGIKIKL